jgi:hypothetical protein
MKTPDLIRKLSEDLRPAPAGFLLKRAAAYAAGTLAVAALALAVLPIRPDLAGRTGAAFYWVETVLWAAVTLLAAWQTFETAVPGLWRPARQAPALAALGLLTAALLARLSGAGLGAELLGEFDAKRGDCGWLILAIAGAESPLLFWLARQGAPTRPRATAAWAAVSAGCLGALVMQFVCYRDNSLHVFVWHFTAVALAVGAAAAAGKRALRW